MTVIMRGIPELFAGLEALNVRMEAATRKATADALHLIERRTKQKLGQSSHPRGTRRPLVLALDAPPSLVTGNLRRSIQVTGPESVGGGAWRGQVGPTAIYGRVQELGGGRSRLPARPYLQPSAEELKPEIGAAFVAAWRAALLK